MKIPLLAWVYRVRSTVPGWRGWRLHVTYLSVAHACDFDLPDPADGCGCTCCSGTPHRHWGFGASSDRPIGEAPWVTA